MTSSVSNNSVIQNPLYIQADQTNTASGKFSDKQGDQQQISADSLLFDSLLSERHQTESESTAHLPAGQSDLKKPVPDDLSAIPNYQLNGALSKEGGSQLSTMSASTVSNSSVGTNVHTSAITNTFSSVITQVSSTISAFSPALANLPHSFVLSIPGHSNITVHTSVTQSGTRKLQLESDELKFQTWLENNKTKLSDALAKELNMEIALSTSGEQPHATSKQTLAGQRA